MWSCDECTSENEPTEIICSTCSTSKPLNPFTTSLSESSSTESTTRKPKTVRRPHILFYIRNGNVRVRESTIDKIRTRFDKKLPIVVLVAAGIVGAGKSTWINSLLVHLSDKPVRPFEVGHSCETQTEGLWVFPYRLTSRKYPTVQFLICDMEGMGGIKKQKAEEVNKGLNKLYMATMLLSSVFTLHTQNRPEGSVVDSLKATALIIQSQREILVDLPRVYMVVKDTHSIQTKSSGISFLETLKVYGNLDESLLSLLEIVGRPPLPTEIQDKKHITLSALEGSDYMNFNVNFLKSISVHIKKQPATTSPSSPEQLCQLIKQIAEVINLKSYLNYFKGSMEEVVYTILHPVVEKYTATFHEKAINEALIFETSKVDDFIPHLNTLRNQLLTEYDEEVKILISLPSESQIFKNFKAQVVTAIKNSTVAENQFLYRAQQEKDKKELQLKIENLLAENKKKEEKNENAMKALKKKQHSLVHELEKTKTERQDMVKQMQEIQKQAEQYKALYDQINEKFNDTINMKTKSSFDQLKQENATQAEIFAASLIEMIKQNNLSTTVLDNTLNQMKQVSNEKRHQIAQIESSEKTRLAMKEYHTGKKYYDEEDFGAALAHFQVASDNGEVASSYYLGEIYSRGLGVDVDVWLALDYYKLAIDRGYRPAVHKHKDLLSTLSKTERQNLPSLPSPRTVPLSTSPTLTISLGHRLQNEKLILKPSTTVAHLSSMASEDSTFRSAISILENIIKGIGAMSDVSYIFAEDCYSKHHQKRRSPIHNLTVDEIAALNIYTREWPDITDSLYYKLNQSLREGTNLERYRPLITLMLSGLKKMEPCKSTVWRAVSFVDVSNLYEKNSEVCWQAFSSCTKSLSVCGANGFLTASGNRTLFNIEAIRAYTIADLSCFSSENEVLFPPMVTFRVVDLIRSGDMSIVHLQQVS